MKRLLIAHVLFVSLCTLAFAGAKPPAGPKGGRLLDPKATPRSEFIVGKDRTVTVAFYDEQLKPVPVAGQSVTVVADTPGGKAVLSLEKSGDVLASKAKLPEGSGYTVVVQLKQTAEAKPQNYRFKIDLHQCGGCQRAEYACTCGH